MLPRHYHCRKMVEHVDVPWTSHFLPTRSKWRVQARRLRKPMTELAVVSCIMTSCSCWRYCWGQCIQFDPTEQKVSRRRQGCRRPNRVLSRQDTFVFSFPYLLQSYVPTRQGRVPLDWADEVLVSPRLPPFSWYLWGKVGVQPKKRLDVWCQGALSWTSGALRKWRLNHSNLVHDKLWISFGRTSIRLFVLVAATIVVVVVKCMLLALSEGEILSHQIYSRREPRCGQRDASVQYRVLLADWCCVMLEEGWCKAPTIECRKHAAMQRMMGGAVGAMAPKRKWLFSIISKDIGGTTNHQPHCAYWIQYDLHLLAIHALLKWIYSILKYMAYSSYWRGWMKSIQIFYFCFAAPSLLARLRYGHKMVGSCREILLRKISKVQSGRTSGMICSHNGKIGLVGNVRSRRKEVALKVKEQATTAKLEASEFKEVQSIVTKDV